MNKLLMGLVKRTDLLFEEEIITKPNKKGPECLDYSACREKHCRGYGKINCKYHFKRRVKKIEIPCMSYRED
mgnify:CR=1 FL=1